MTRNRELNICLKGGLLTASLLILSCILSATAAAQTFDRVLQQNGVSFHVSCPNDSSLSQLTIIPSGLEIDNSRIRQEIDGMVTEAEIADLNRDGFPEIYVYVTSAGSGSYGSLVAYSSNRNKSLSSIYLPPLEDDRRNAKGYMGHDTFAVSGPHLLRRFPLYRDGDTNAKPTGGMRQLEFKLVPGEATWQLELVKSTDI